MKRGFSLPEVLVVMFLSGTVLSLIASLLLPSLWMWRVESARGEAQQGVMMVTSRLHRALMNSELETVTIAPDYSAIGFQEIIENGAPFDATTGMAIMQDRFRVFFWDARQKRVLTKTWGPAQPPPALTGYDFSATATRPQRLSVADLRQICDTTNGTEQVLARNVSIFKVTDADENLALLDPPIHCHVECKIDTSQQGAIDSQSCRMDISANPRNLRW